MAGELGCTVLTGRAVAGDVPAPFRPALGRLVPGWRQAGGAATALALGRLDAAATAHMSQAYVGAVAHGRAA